MRHLWCLWYVSPHLDHLSCSEVIRKTISCEQSLSKYSWWLTVLFRITLTRTITLYELQGSYQLLCFIDKGHFLLLPESSFLCSWGFRWGEHCVTFQITATCTKETNLWGSQSSFHTIKPVFELRLEIAEQNILLLVVNLPGLQTQVTTDKQKFYISTIAQPLWLVKNCYSNRVDRVLWKSHSAQLLFSIANATRSRTQWEWHSYKGWSCKFILGNFSVLRLSMSLFWYINLKLGSEA